MSSPSSKDSLPEGGRLTIDLEALADNWRRLNEISGSAECGAAVKADAYGIGIEPAGQTLWSAGCRTFFVALPEEGLRLRALLPEAVIYILNGLFEGAASCLADADLHPVLGSLEEISDWADFGRRSGRALPAALHVDTGMNRLGLAMSEAEALAANDGLLQSVDWSLLMSHLACADTPGHKLNDRQKQSFDRCRSMFPDLPASLANSAGILSRRDWHFDMVRPGIALYGGEAVAGEPNPMRPLVTLEGRIIQVRDVEAGETVGYGATQAATRPSRIALVSIGYADGFHRLGGSTDTRTGTHVWLDDTKVPLFGRVSMDLLAIDVTDVSPRVARRGSWVELIGPHIPLDDVARASETIGYELLTQLGARYSRGYIDPGSIDR